MIRTSALRDAWHPQTREDRDAILRELQAILASPHFCNSKRYPALLQYVVENTLAGKSELLKERTLGVEVFDRSPSYDTNADTVVRYTAGEVRKRLSLYYHELDEKPVIQISLPPGSYIPEFLHSQDEPKEVVGHTDTLVASSGLTNDPAGHAILDVVSPWTGESDLHPTPLAEVHPHARAGRRRWWLSIAALLAVIALLGFGWRYRAAHRSTPIDEFWAPILHNQTSVMVCSGGSVFSQSHVSGVDTAGKDIVYPFVSMQSASAIASLAAMIERNGATTQLQSAATTPLTELRDRPVILLGGFNNEWSVRLLDPLPYHLVLLPDEAIVETAQPTTRWVRDPSLPYSSADDYALVARFRDTTTDGWVVVLAGVGRNGTEAAAQFATSPHYMQMLRDKLGSNIANRNIEIILRVKVIDGKTGAPSIQAVRAW
jgi:hypothetical protein